MTDIVPTELKTNADGKAKNSPMTWLISWWHWNALLMNKAEMKTWLLLWYEGLHELTAGLLLEMLKMIKDPVLTTYTTEIGSPKYIHMHASTLTLTDESEHLA